MLRMETAMNDAIQKFKEMLSRIQTVSVKFGTNEHLNKIISAAILHKAFVKLGKKSSFDVNILDEKTKRFAEALCGELHSSSPQENLIIKLDAKSMPVSELQYEKEGDIFKIILQSNGALNPKNVTVETECKPVDLLLLVDPKDSTIETMCSATPHKEVIKLGSKDRGLPIKIYEIVSALFSETPAELKNPLLYIISQQEKEEKSASPKLLEIKKQLLDGGANQQTINEARGELLGSSFWKLLGRALARSEYEKRIGAVWSFLPHADLQKTSQNNTVIAQVFEEFRALRPEGKFFALLWENAPKSISAIIGGQDAERISSLATLMQSQLSSTYFFVHGFETFSEAELKIRSHIQKIL